VKQHLTINWLNPEPKAIFLKITTVTETQPRVVAAQKPRKKQAVKNRTILAPLRSFRPNCARG
jgi:hypothetical protein